MGVIEAPQQTPPIEAPAPTKRDVLHRAADLLEEFGWCRFNFGSNAEGDALASDDPRADRFCLLGALSRACLDLGLSYADRSRFYPELSAVIGDRHPMMFNDSVAKDKNEVVAVLRKAADRA